MEDDRPSGTVMVYSATCALAVGVTIPGAMIVMVAEADLVESLTLVAVMVTVVFWVTVGAVKLPLVSTEPAAAPAPAAPPEAPTDHVTPELSFITETVNCMVWPLPRYAA